MIFVAQTLVQQALATAGHVLMPGVLCSSPTSQAESVAHAHQSGCLRPLANEKSQAPSLDYRFCSGGVSCLSG